MATEDTGPIVWPDGWSTPAEPESAPPVVVDLGESFGLDEFAPEGETMEALRPSETRAEPRVEPAIEKKNEAPRVDLPHAATLLDLIERRDGMDWREAVAVIQRLCVHLRDSSVDHPIVLDPRNILLTADGEIRVTHGQIGGDPLVMQIGRLLRALLLNKPVPAEVRLILSQATFELPIFDSVETLARALAQVTTLHQIDGVSSAYARAIAPIERPYPAETLQVSPPARPFLPIMKRRRPPLAKFRYEWNDMLVVAGVAFGTVLCCALVFNQWTAMTQSSIAPFPTAVSDSIVDMRSVPALGATAIPDNAPPPMLADTPSRAVEPARPFERATPRETTREARAVAKPEAAVRPPATAPAESVRTSPRDAAQRAVILLQAGKRDEAEVAFDAFVLTNPLYEPGPGELGTEAYEALQASRRAVLPGVAIREVARAKATLAKGDLDLALAAATDADAVLDRAGTGAPPGLRQQVQALVDEILVARTAADGVVFSDADPGVVPPRALSRGFPLNPPEGVRRDRVGVLEIIVSKKGDVEFVKLHTPLNRYHERMVVSAAKAWRYVPARKDGTAVRFKLMVTVNLPEAGT